MGLLKGSRRRAALLAASAAVAVAGGLGVASAAGNTTPSNAMGAGRGVNEFGMTDAFYDGQHARLHVHEGLLLRHERRVGGDEQVRGRRDVQRPRPAQQFDPLYITVPLGFDVPMNMQDCPSTLVCVDHPGTIDLTRLEPALKPLYPQLTDAQLTDGAEELRGARPRPLHHRHEQRQARVVGRADRRRHQPDDVRGDPQPTSRSSYIQQLIKQKNKNVVGPIPSNLFLYFSVQ